MWMKNLVTLPSLALAQRPSNPPTLYDPTATDVGPAVRVAGALTGSGDLAVDGEIDGTIELHGFCLTVGPHARVSAPINARRVRIAGHVVGDVTATEAVEVDASGSVAGNIVAPMVAIADGARFTGSIDMRPDACPTAEVTRLTPRDRMALAG